MTNLNKIKQGSVEEIASMFVIQGEHEEFDYDWDEQPISNVVDCWYTPVGVFPGYWARKEVIDCVIEWLMSEDR